MSGVANDILHQTLSYILVLALCDTCIHPLGYGVIWGRIRME